MNPLSEKLRNCFYANLSSKGIRIVLMHLVCKKKLVYGEAKNDATNKMIGNLISGYKKQHFEFSFRTRKNCFDNKLSEKEYQKRRKKMMKLLKKKRGAGC